MRMTDMANVAQLSDDEYRSIWSALMETPRGRRFLSEFARRTRTAESRTLLDSVQTLERALIAERTRADGKAAPELRPPEPLPAGPHLRAIIGGAVEVLDSVVRINGNAAIDVRKAVDGMQETVEILRDGGVRAAICDELRQQIEEIHEIVTVQQIATERTARITEAMAALDDRLRRASADDRASTPKPPLGAAARTREPLPHIGRHGVVDDSEIQRLQQALRS